MWLDVFEGLSIPFLGTVIGSACVFFMKKELSRNIQRALTGFACNFTTDLTKPVNIVLFF